MHALLFLHTQRIIQKQGQPKMDEEDEDEEEEIENGIVDIDRE